MTVHLLRHAQSTANAEGWVNGRGETELSDQGRRQAHEFGSENTGRFRGVTLVSSSAKRAYQTAVILAEYFEIAEGDIITSDLCIERDFGKFEGFSKPEFKQALRADKAKGEMEPLAHLKQRALKFARQLRQYQPPVLVVSHQVFMKMFRQLAVDPGNWRRAMEAPRINNLDPVEIELAKLESGQG